MLLTRSYCHHSLLSAVPKVNTLITEAKNRGYTSIALTDEDTGSALVEFYETCQKEGVKPVLGVTLRVPNSKKNLGLRGGKEFSKVAILAKNKRGYSNLLEIISLARTEREKPEYHVLLSDLAAKKDEENKLNFFVVLSGNDHELIGALRKGEKKEALGILQNYVKTLGAENLLVELAMPLGGEEMADNKKLNLSLIEICQKERVKYIASPAPRYLNPEGAESFRVVLAIKKQVKLYDIALERDFTLLSKDQLLEMFAYCPEALETAEIEEQIETSLRTDYDKYASEAFFPHFDLPSGQTPPGQLTWETYIGLITIFHPSGKGRSEWKEVYPYEKTEKLKEDCAQIIPDTSKLLGYPKEHWQQKSVADYVQRIEKELNIIITKGYPSYFLVLADIMQYCRDNGIVINTRGSAAGCLIGYLTGINILDPLVYDIPFERFLNPLRPSAPDIDGDFADDRREEVIRYITQKYGQDKVCQIITFGTMLPRAAVRDIGRVLGVSYSKCDALSKLIPTAPQGRKTTFKWAFETSEELKGIYEKDAELRRIMDIAQKIEGNYRHSSVHAAGVIITPTKVSDYCPLQWDSDHKGIACQYDMRYCEKVGLVKMDILGITNLSILGNAIELAQKTRNEKIDLSNIDLSSPKAFDLLAKGRTMGLFQLSGPALTRYLVQLEPSKVQDLMAMVALYRPGPMGNIPEYIKRKKNPKLIDYFHPKAKEWMEPSYGILVYQEDVLYGAIELAGYDWGEADVLRKGMGKKIKEVIDSQHIRFVEGCQTHSGMTAEEAEKIWSLIEPFSAYGFNKAHSSNYGMVAYWTAYVKANYPAEFMTALMTRESGDVDKVASAIKECRELGLEVLPPDINQSFDSYSIESAQIIRYGLSSIKNLGSDVIKFIINEREKNGKFKDLEDFLDRVSSYPQFSKKSLEALIFAGCLDSLAKKELTRIGKSVEKNEKMAVKA